MLTLCLSSYPMLCASAESRLKETSRHICLGTNCSALPERQRCPLDPAEDGSLGNLEAEHEQFAVNARSAPGRILRHHLKDQIADLLGHPIPSQSPSRFGDQNSSTGENQHDASGRPSQDGRARETASKRPKNDGRIPRRFCQPLPSGLWDACASARPAVAGEQDFPRSRLPCDCKQRLSKPNPNPT